MIRKHYMVAFQKLHEPHEFSLFQGEIEKAAMEDDWRHFKILMMALQREIERLNSLASTLLPSQTDGKGL